MSVDSCLGYGEYRALIVARQTCKERAHVVGDELNPSSVQWERTLNAISTGQIVVPLQDDSGSCCDVISQIDPVRHELEILRNDETVWVGPILSVVIDPLAATATINAQDLAWWLSVRVIQQDFSWTGTDLATIFGDLVDYAVSVDDPGITLSTSPTGILGDRSVGGTDVRTVLGEIEELSRTGVDWTVCGRQFFVGGLTTTDTMLRTPLTEHEFTRLPAVRRSADQMANHTFVYGSGIVGEAGGQDTDDCVLVERAIYEPSALDQNSCDAAAQSLWERVHEPLYILEGDSDLSYSAPIDIQEMIPGQLVRVDIGGCLPYTGVLRLQTVRAKADFSGETITVGAQPAGAINV